MSLLRMLARFTREIYLAITSFDEGLIPRYVTVQERGEKTHLATALRHGHVSATTCSGSFTVPVCNHLLAGIRRRMDWNTIPKICQSCRVRVGNFGLVDHKQYGSTSSEGYGYDLSTCVQPIDQLVSSLFPATTAILSCKIEPPYSIMVNQNIRPVKAGMDGHNKVVVEVDETTPLFPERLASYNVRGSKMRPRHLTDHTVDHRRRHRRIRSE
jgi:hypothetical protein